MEVKIDFKQLLKTLNDLEEKYIIPNVIDGHCKECGYCVNTYPNFCPNCGIKLKYK